MPPILSLYLLTPCFLPKLSRHFQGGQKEMVPGMRILLSSPRVGLGIFLVFMAAGQKIYHLTINHWDNKRTKEAAWHLTSLVALAALIIGVEGMLCLPPMPLARDGRQSTAGR